MRQLEQDPDDIFIGASSCSLDEGMCFDESELVGFSLHVETSFCANNLVSFFDCKCMHYLCVQEFRSDVRYLPLTSPCVHAVFEVKGSKKRPDFKRRGSSGDWVKDCLTWQEQIQYKVTMGYLH